jgi:Berberine and berberine like
VLIDQLDGAIRDVDSGGSAFPWRAHAACVQWYVELASAAAVSAAWRWVSAAHSAVQPYSAGGYVNYIEQNTRAVRYFGANLARLSTIRQKYDPGQLMFSGLSL